MINIEQRKQLYGNQIEELEKKENQEKQEPLYNEKRSPKKSKWTVLFVGMVVFVLFLIVLGKLLPREEQTNIKTNDTVMHKTIFNELPNVDNELAKVSKYYSYGTHFNMKGLIPMGEEKNQVKKVSVIMQQKEYSQEVNENGQIVKTTKKENQVLPASFKVKKDGLKFYLSKYIDGGIDLEDDMWKENSWIFFLKVEYEEKTATLHSFEDTTKEKEITYYTVTKNKKNSKIQIAFSYPKEEKVSILTMKVKEETLPPEIYDIVIDPGHGGADSGAIGNGYVEAQENLKLSKKIAALLQEKGYKVKLTRDGSENPLINTTYTMYDEDGRVNVSCKTKSKLGLSIHENSASGMVAGGTEVYSSVKSSGVFGKMVADSIVDVTNAKYSGFAYYKKAEGSYQRHFTKSEIQNAKQDAITRGYHYYENVDVDTDYYFFMRELGGIATNAMIDGRNKKFGVNQYLLSNQGIESIIVESGYICVAKDARDIHRNMDIYSNAIVTAIEKRLNVK